MKGRRQGVWGSWSGVGSEGGHGLEPFASLGDAEPPYLHGTPGSLSSLLLASGARTPRCWCHSLATTRGYQDPHFKDEETEGERKREASKAVPVGRAGPGLEPRPEPRPCGGCSVPVTVTGRPQAFGSPPWGPPTCPPCSQFLPTVS